MRFFRPDALRVLLFAVFLAIAVLGWLESGAFSEQRDGPTTAVWPVWVLLLAPLAALPGDVLHAGPAMFWVAQTVWFYTLACAIAWVTGIVRRKVAGDVSGEDPRSRD